MYVLTADYQSKIEKTGARFIPYPPIQALSTINQLASGGNIPYNAHILLQIGEQLLPFVFELIETEQPDYILFDSLCGWAKMALRKYPLPNIATISTFLIHPRNPPPLGIGDILKTVGQLAGEVGGYLQTRRRISANHGVKSIGLFEAVMCLGDRNIIYTSREFQPMGHAFDTSLYKFVGPCIAPRDEVLDIPQPFLTDRPLVYISLGTINNTNIDFFKQCLTAFHDVPAHVVMSIGNQLKADDLGTIPENFIIRNFVPQLELLKHTHIFITHGGMNSVQESLLEGVPMIVVPQQVEQQIVANQIKKSEAGIVVGSKISVNGLKSGLQLMLDDHARFKANAEKLGKTLKDSGSTSRAVDEILAYCQTKT